MAKKKKSKSEKAIENFYNQIKENKKPKRTIKTSRLIEEKLRELELSKLDEFNSSDLSSSVPDVEPQKQIISVNQLSEDRQEEDDYEHSYLFVLEPSDLDELSLDEVKIVWENREKLCGSDRAAAEALALVEVDAEITDTYKGWQSYLNHPDIIDFRVKKEIQTEIPNSEKLISNETQAPQPKALVAEEKASEGYKLAHIQELSLKELKAAWSDRPVSFYSLEAASETLARIRFESNIDDEKCSWEQLISHPSITEISADLEMETKTQNGTDVQGNAEQLVFNKVYGLVKQQIRFGQSDFRETVISTYKSICCITGCTEINSLEAAHIRPYSGQSSNTANNSLLLRADIHKLFDRFLISINPSDLTLQISDNINDDYYRSLNGKKLFKQGFVPSVQLLEEHFRTFIKMHNFIKAS